MPFSKLWSSPRLNTCKNTTEEKWLLWYYLRFQVFWKKAKIINLYFSKLASQNTTESKFNIYSIFFFNLLCMKMNYHTMVWLLYIKCCICFSLFIVGNTLLPVAFVTSITNMSFESKSVTTCGNNKFETIFLQNFSRIFKSVSITGFKTSHTAFTCIKKSSMLYLFQRVIRNWSKIDTNWVSITNWGKIITNLGSSICYNSGQFQLLQIRTGITNWGNYYKLELDPKYEFIFFQN